MNSFLLIFLILLIVAAFMLFVLWVGWTWTLKKPKYTLSPYTKTPLRRANTIRYTSFFRIKKYLKEMEDLHNRAFDLNRAAIDRETGMIFPDCVKWNGKIELDWTFLQKREPGIWVSWGSLPEERRKDLLIKHGSLEGFQTVFSSPRPLPQNVEIEYTLEKPGPLYVNLENNMVMGWKVIPDTDFEVLVVKEPIKHIHLTL